MDDSSVDPRSASAAPGRICPPHYGYSPRVFARPPEIIADTIYVIGGLYGNVCALDAIDALAAAEAEAPRLVFNGDFHWFDVDADAFLQVQRRVMNAANFVIRGNVETEIGTDDAAAGCGCAYPESVSDDDVERSNAILRSLRSVATELSARGIETRAAQAALPMHAVAQVNGTRIGIAHGDAWSLAGWRFAHDALHDPAREPALASAFESAAVDGFACSHTCLPALKYMPTAGGERFVINNGAAGMPNFAGQTWGLLSRISVRPVPAAAAAHRIYGVHAGDVYVDAMAVRYDATAWRQRFLGTWPAGSPAHASYFERIEHGPRFSIDAALGRGGLNDAGGAGCAAPAT